MRALDLSIRDVKEWGNVSIMSAEVSKVVISAQLAEKRQSNEKGRDKQQRTVSERRMTETPPR